METLLGIGFASILATLITVLFLVFIRKQLKQMFDAYCEIEQPKDSCPFTKSIETIIRDIEHRLNRIEDKLK